MLGGTVIIAFALVGALAPTTSEPPDVIADAFRAEAAMLCTDIVNDRSFEAWDVAEAAGIDVLTFAVDPPSDRPQPTEDEVGSWVAALEPRLADLTDARDRLAELQDDADDISEPVGLAWSQVVIAGDDLIEAQTVRLDALTSDQPWTAVAARVSPLPSPVVPPEALATLGMFLRDCEHVYTHQGVPDGSRGFVTAAATACATAVTRRTVNGFFDDEGLLFQSGSTILDGGVVEITEELVAAVDGRVGEHAVTADELAAVPTDDVPDGAAWNARLAFERALVGYWTGVASALAGGDPAVAAAAIQVVADIPSDTDPLSTLFLNQRDCQVLYSQADPVPGGGIAPGGPA